MQIPANRSFILYILVLFCATLLSLLGVLSLGATLVFVHLLWAVSRRERVGRRRPQQLLPQERPRKLRGPP